jgi:hypothetical protein
MPVPHTDINQVHSHMHTKLSEIHQTHANNGVAAFRLDEKLKSDPALLEFKKDPIAVAKREGFIVPDGFLSISSTSITNTSLVRATRFRNFREVSPTLFGDV